SCQPCRFRAGRSCARAVCHPIDRLRFGLTDAQTGPYDCSRSAVVVDNNITDPHSEYECIPRRCGTATGFDWCMQGFTDVIAVGHLHEAVLVGVTVPVVRHLALRLSARRATAHMECASSHHRSYRFLRAGRSPTLSASTGEMHNALPERPREPQTVSGTAV